jgi:Uma2 family endonuclease
MSVSTAEATPKAKSTPQSTWRTHRWTTAEFDAMVGSGYLREGSKTFLWDGEIIEPMPENEPHVTAQDNLYRLLIGRLPEAEWTIRPAHPLVLREGYKPQPDLVVLIEPRTDRRGRTPTALDAALVIEIADSSYAEDAGDKLPEYAAAGIPRYWIVNIGARRIEVYSQPTVASGVGQYVVREDYPLEVAVPLVLVRGGESYAFGLIPVLEVLRDSLEGE